MNARVKAIENITAELYDLTDRSFRRQTKRKKKLRDLRDALSFAEPMPIAKPYQPRGKR